MGLVTLLFCREKPKAVSAYLTSNQILPFGLARQYTAHFRRPFINARVSVTALRVLIHARWFLNGRPFKNGWTRT